MNGVEHDQRGAPVPLGAERDRVGEDNKQEMKTGQQNLIRRNGAATALAPHLFNILSKQQGVC
jgi:hypothetical protein